MTKRVVYAGIDERLRRKLRQASHFLADTDTPITVAEWDGGAFDLLVADSQDPQGATAVASSRGAGLPVVGVATEAEVADGGAYLVAPENNTARITRVLSDALGVGESPDQIAICRLANDAALRGRDVDADYLGQRVSLRPSLGRAFAHSYSDFQTLSQGLGTPRWRFSEAVASGRDSFAGLASMSLEAFFIRGAHACAASLPPFPDGHYKLDDWPDLGAISDLVYPLKLTQLLLRGAMTPADLASMSGLKAQEVTAGLWGLRAAGQLHVGRARDAVASGQPSGRGGLLGRLGARFGLGATG